MMCIKPLSSNYQASIVRSIRNQGAAFLTLLAVLIAGYSSAAAVPRNDVNADGYSDATMIAIGDGGVLNWSSLSGPTAESIKQQSSFGAVGDNITLAPWFTAGTANYSLVTLRSSNIFWRAIDSQGQVIERRFGKSGDTVLSGADFDGNGVADAAVITPSSANLVWTIQRNLFNPSTRSVATRAGVSPQSRALPATISVRFGSKKDTPFFADPDGKGDWLAVVKAGDRSISYFHPFKRRTRTFTLSGFTAGELGALPLKQSGVPDQLVFPIRGAGSTTFYLTNFSGALINQFSIAATGDIILGNFTDLNNPQVAVQSSEGNFIVYTPATQATTTMAYGGSIPVDAVNVNLMTTVPPTPTPAGRARNHVNNPAPSGGSLESICTTMHRMNRTVLYKPGSGGTSDSRTGKPAFLWYDCQDQGVLNLWALASNGTVISRFALYTPSVCPLVRFYSGYRPGYGDSGTKLMEKAQAASGSKFIYFYTQDGNCWGPVKNANGRSGGK